jgi:hypothetical protein
MGEDVKPWNMIDGSDRASEEESAMRYNICKGCEFFRPMTKRCVECGCFMKLKTQLAQAKCPKGKW